jgi:hypothetical protein
LFHFRDTAFQRLVSGFVAQGLWLRVCGSGFVLRGLYLRGAAESCGFKLSSEGTRTSDDATLRVLFMA